MKDNDNLDLFAGRVFEGVLWTDAYGKVLAWNPGAERITGYPPEKILGKAYQKQPARHVGPTGQELSQSSVPLLSTLQDGRSRESLAFLRHAGGYQISVLVRTFALVDDHKSITGAIEIFSDNRAFIAAFQATQRTENTVLLDPLTGIGNRRHIETKIQMAIEDYHQKKTRFGILFVDIDHFKDFNDTHGHLVGDKVLRLVANTIRQSLRLTDSCGRWGGEEIIALAYDLDLSGLKKVSEKLRAAIEAARVQDANLNLNVTASVGSTLVRPTDTLQTIINRADRLMYKSKQNGRNRATVEV